MNKEFWDERYADSDFTYGKEPNVIFKKYLAQIPKGKILFPAEGEGRNAVFAATLGWDVYAFDISQEGKNKAEKLAKDRGVDINYTITDFEHYIASENFFDCIALIFTHLPTPIRKASYQHLLQFLKPGGSLIVIGFSKDQLGKPSGGPKDIDMLFSREQLQTDFSNLINIETQQAETTLNEGPFHQGDASVIWLTGGKRKILDSL